MINLNAWFQKHGLCAENILYIYRKDRKTVIQRTDGAEFALSAEQNLFNSTSSFSLPTNLQNSFK